MNFLKKYERYFLWGIIGAFFALSIMPFIVTESLYFPYVAGKGFYFRILVEFMVVLYIVLATINPKYRVKKKPINFVILFLLISFLISNMLSPNSYKSFLSNYERMDGYINLLHLCVMFFITSRVMTVNLWNKFFNTSVIVSFCVSCYVFLQLAGVFVIHQGGVRVDGPLGNATYLSVYMLFNLGFALYLFFRNRKTEYLKYFYVLLAILNLIVIYFTATRGVILGLFVGAVLSPIIIAIFSRQKTMIKTSITIVVAVVVFVGLFVAIRNTSFVTSSLTLSRFSSLSLDTIKNQGRFKIWNMAIEGIKERPIFGWGQESFNFVFNEKYDPSLWGDEQWFDRTHNIVFDSLVSGGIVGGVLYLSLFVFAMYWIIKREDFELGERVVLLGLVIAYGFQNLFVFDNPTSYFLWFSLLAFLSFKEDENDTETELEENSLHLASSLIAVVVVIYCSSVFTVKPIRASQNLIDGLSAQRDVSSYQALLNNIYNSKDGIELKRSHIENIIQNPYIDNTTKDLLKRFRKGNDSDSLISVVSTAINDSAKSFLINMGEAIDLETFGSSEVLEQLAISAGGIAHNESFPKDVREAFVKYAKEQIKIYTNNQSNDARRLLIAGSMSRQLGEVNTAIDYLEKALALSPKKQSIMLELSIAYLQKEDSENYLKITKTAFDLDQNYVEGRLAYAGALLYAGDEKQGMEIINYIIENIAGGEATVYNNNVLLQICADIENYDFLEKIWKWRIDNNPSDINNRIALSAVYYEKGQRTKAIEELETAIEINPAFKETGEKYIADIKAGKKPE